jgi:hypothetical protein
VPIQSSFPELRKLKPFSAMKSVHGFSGQQISTNLLDPSLKTSSSTLANGFHGSSSTTIHQTEQNKLKKKAQLKTFVHMADELKLHSNKVSKTLLVKLFLAKCLDLKIAPNQQ